MAGGQRDNRIELAKTTVGSAVSEETSKSDTHDSVTHAMTKTRTGLRAVGGCGRVPYDYSEDSRDFATMAPGPRTEKKLADFPFVARSPSRTDESASTTAPIHIPMEPQRVVNQAKNRPSTGHQFFKRGESSATCIPRLSWLGSCAKGEVALLTFWFSARSAVLSGAHVCSG